MSTDITVVTPVRTPHPRLEKKQAWFRDEQWVEKYLSTLSDQTYPCRKYIVDYNSASECRKWIRKLCHKYNAKYIFVPLPVDTISKVAVNYGLRFVETEYFMTSNIDCYFGTEFIEKVMYELKRGEKRIITVLAKEMDKDVQIGFTSKRDFGCAMAVRTDWIMSVGGFDERLKCWGLDDADMIRRAKADGMEHLWVGSDLYSREHLTVKHTHIEHNEKIADDPEVVRNKDGWGGQK